MSPALPPTSVSRASKLIKTSGDLPHKIGQTTATDPLKNLPPRLPSQPPPSTLRANQPIQREQVDAIKGHTSKAAIDKNPGDATLVEKKNQNLEQVESPNKVSSLVVSTNTSQAKSMDIAATIIGSVCSEFTEVLMKQINGSEEYNPDELAKDVEKKMNEMKMRIAQSQTQPKAGNPPSMVGSCLKSASSAAVEWAAKKAKDTLIPGETTTTAGSNTDTIVVKCENMNSCIALSSDVQIDIKFNAAALPPSTTPSNVPTQPTQPLIQRRGLPLELDTFSSSATSFNQYSSFRDSNSVALTLALMVMLYMYIFNFRR